MFVDALSGKHNKVKKDPKELLKERKKVVKKRILFCINSKF